MIEKLYKIEHELYELRADLQDYVNDISYYCKLRDGRCGGCPFYKSYTVCGIDIFHKCQLDNKPSRWYNDIR